jgi:hypothetical protein
MILKLRFRNQLRRQIIDMLYLFIYVYSDTKL